MSLIPQTDEDTGLHQYWSPSTGPIRFLDRCDECVFEAWERMTYGGMTPFIADCLTWRGRELTGHFAHICWDWDGLPIDETCREWPCGCFNASR